MMMILGFDVMRRKKNIVRYNIIENDESHVLCVQEWVFELRKRKIARALLRENTGARSIARALLEANFRLC